MIIPMFKSYRKYYTYLDLNIGIIYNKIGAICSLSNALSIVGTKYLKSATIDRGLVMGLSCLNGTKK